MDVRSDRKVVTRPLKTRCCAHAGGAQPPRKRAAARLRRLGATRSQCWSATQNWLPSDRIPRHSGPVRNQGSGPGRRNNRAGDFGQSSRSVDARQVEWMRLRSGRSARRSWQQMIGPAIDQHNGRIGFGVSPRRREARLTLRLAKGDRSIPSPMASSQPTRPAPPVVGIDDDFAQAAHAGSLPAPETGASPMGPHWTPHAQHAVVAVEENWIPPRPHEKDAARLAVERGRCSDSVSTKRQRDHLAASAGGDVLLGDADAARPGSRPHRCSAEQSRGSGSLTSFATT